MAFSREACALPRGAPPLARCPSRDAGPPLRSTRHARRSHRPDAAREAAPLRRGLDAVRLAGARGRTRRFPDAADGARRGPRRARPRGSGPVLVDRGARADADRLRAAGARRRGRPAAAVGRRAVVPGLLRAGLRQRPRLLALPRRARGRRRSHGHEMGDQRSEGVDQPGPVLGPLRAAHAHGPRRLTPPRHHRLLRRHGYARDPRRAARDDQRRARVRRGLLRRRRGSRRPDAR